MGNSQNKQFISFKLQTFLNSMMKSHSVLPWPWIISLSPVSSLSLSSHLDYQHCCRACVQVTLLLLNNGPKVQAWWWLTIRKFGYAKRSCKLLPLSEKSLCLSKERKNKTKLYAWLLRSVVRISLLSVKLWKRKK